MVIWFADILVNGMAALAVGLVVYLGCLAFQQKLKGRKQQKERQRQQRGHWGYE